MIEAENPDPAEDVRASRHHPPWLDACRTTPVTYCSRRRTCNNQRSKTNRWHLSLALPALTKTEDREFASRTQPARKQTSPAPLAQSRATLPLGATTPPDAQPCRQPTGRVDAPPRTAALQHGSRREETPRSRRRPRGLRPAASSGGGMAGGVGRSTGGARVGRAPESPCIKFSSWHGRIHLKLTACILSAFIISSVHDVCEYIQTYSLVCS